MIPGHLQFPMGGSLPSWQLQPKANWQSGKLAAVSLGTSPSHVSFLFSLSLFIIFFLVSQ